MQHPLAYGEVFHSPGGHFTYRVIGPCCRLFDREELPWPCCRLEWRGKEPSWRRIGRRFVLDMATQHSPSYSVEIIGQEYSGKNIVITLYAVKLPPSVKEWWFTRRLKSELSTVSTTPAEPSSSSDRPVSQASLALFN